MPTDAKTKPQEAAEEKGQTPAESPAGSKSARKSQKSKKGQSQTPSTDVAELQAQLGKKEDVVAALTARLEQAAEQLDRFRRNGSNGRGQSSGGGSLPQDLVQEQRAITEELQQAVQHWEDMQAGAALGRIEMQVTELRDFIAGRFDELSEFGGVRSSSSSSSSDGSLEAALAEIGIVSEEPDEADDASASPMSAYEMLKADLFASDGASSAPAPEAPAVRTPAPASAEADSPAVEAEETATTNEPVFEEIPEAAAPVPIDISQASLEELQSAVETRDAYISYLIRRLRAAENTTRISGDWAALENVPDELRARLEQLEKRLQDAHRIAEVENSLERARLAREAARLELLEQQMQKRMRQLGIDDRSDADSKDAAAELPAKKSRSWLKRLGVGRDDDES